VPTTPTTLGLAAYARAFATHSGRSGLEPGLESVHCCSPTRYGPARKPRCCSVARIARRMSRMFGLSPSPFWYEGRSETTIRSGAVPPD
jgi:hypothetical protein